MKVALARFEWKVEDFWIGVFWKVRPEIYYSAKFNDPWLLDVWICLIPCVPFHLRLERPATGERSKR